jgi:hypothetical protein
MHQPKIKIVFYYCIDCSVLGSIPGHSMLSLLNFHWEQFSLSKDNSYHTV